MATTLIGAPLNRVDGRKKVTGVAQYASEMLLGGMTHAVLVGSPISGARIRSIDTSDAEHAPGVLLVLTHENRGPLGEMPDNFFAGGMTAERRPPLADTEILHAGQYVAMIVAERLEQARFAASLLKVQYEPAAFTVTMEEARGTAYRPAQADGEDLQIERGDAQKGFAEADVRLEATYVTPNEHPSPMEPHATVASWSDGTLTVYNSTQWVMGDTVVLQAAFHLPPEKVHVLCPFAGGMFGSKAATGAHVILAALASMKLSRPVKVSLTRTQVLTNVGHRTETVQRLEIGARRDGTLTAIRHHTMTHTGLNDEFIEPASLGSRMLYRVPNYSSTHEVVRLNVMKPSWMRAPGETPGQFALESALDELSYKLGLDPVELRRRNHADVDPQNGRAFSSKHLLECYDRGAHRFGWADRNPEPRSMSDGSTQLGWGMATATFPGLRMGATCDVRLERDSSGVHAVVSTAGSDAGTGMYTVLAIAAAEGLGLAPERVTAELGNSRLSSCAVAGGSNLTASAAPAIMDAAAKIRRQLLEIAGHVADGFTGAHLRPDEFLFQNGRLAHRSDPGHSIGYGDLLALAGRDAIDAQAKTDPIFGHNDQYSFQSFGAHFVEVRVDELIGRVRVSRVVSVFDCGRILSAKSARSQFIGGIVFGIGQALLEDLVYDRQRGHVVNADLAGYLVPVHADIPEMDVSWIDEPDFNFNSLGCRGVGEIGITGVAAAIANAVYHATGVRVRELPISPDRLLNL